MFSPNSGSFRTARDDEGAEEDDKDNLGAYLAPPMAISPALLSPGSPVVFPSQEDTPALEIPAQANTKAGARFRERISARMEQSPEEPMGPKKESGQLASGGKSSIRFPRSPYPSAPFSPIPLSPAADEAPVEGIDAENSDGGLTPIPIVDPIPAPMKANTWGPQRSATVHGDSPVRISRFATMRPGADRDLDYPIFSMRSPLAPQGAPMNRELVYSTHAEKEQKKDIHTSDYSMASSFSLTSPGLSGLSQAFWRSVSIEKPPPSLPRAITIEPRASVERRVAVSPLTPGGIVDKKKAQVLSPPPPIDPFVALPSFASVIERAQQLHDDTTSAAVVGGRMLGVETVGLPEDVVEEE